MKRLLTILLFCFAVSLPALPQANQDPAQQSSSDKSKKGKKESGDKSTAPEGATAKCKDGTYSFSKHHQGTCSHHGGVAEWYK